MALVDVANRVITLKIVYYGCALGGKTTNLITLQRLTDPDNVHGMVSIATKDDRTLFFDLLPMDLGQVGGMTVKAKIYTVPGQVHYELTRRQVLAGADAVVMVVDSDPEVKKSNAWAVENLRYNLKANGLDPQATPTVMQWNKRDLPTARSVGELQAELNPRGLPAIEAVATTGTGVVATFGEALKLGIVRAYERAGRGVAAESIRATVDRALAHAQAREPAPAGQVRQSFDHRFDMESYREEQAQHGRNRQIVDEESLLGEAVQTNMELAERLDQYRDTDAVSRRRASMMHSLGDLAPRVADASTAGLPDGVMATLLRGAERRRGSILFVHGSESVFAEREVVPDGRDPLNAVVAPGLGSVAYQLAQGSELRVIRDLASEVFFDPTAVPPEAADLNSALVAPLSCDGLGFGALIVYGTLNEPDFDDAEVEYWSTAATLIGLSLHWRALRKKLSQARAS